MIREDPANPNLLFAGTEFGLYVTLQPRPELGAHEERAADGPGIRPADSSARARPDPGDARPLHLDHGQHHRAGRNRRQRKRAHHRPAPVHAEARASNGRRPTTAASWGRGLFIAANPQAGAAPRLLREDCGSGARDREGQGGQRGAAVERRARKRARSIASRGTCAPMPRSGRPAERLRRRAAEERWRRWRRGGGGGAGGAAPAAAPGARPAFAAPEAGGGGPGEPAAENRRRRAAGVAVEVAVAAAEASAAIAALW